MLCISIVTQQTIKSYSVYLNLLNFLNDDDDIKIYSVISLLLFNPITIIMSVTEKVNDEY